MPEEIKPIAIRVREVVARHASIDVSDVRPDTSLEDHGLSSLERVEFLMSLEDEFAISIPDPDGDRLDKARVQEWAQYVEARRSAAVQS